MGCISLSYLNISEWTNYNEEVKETKKQKEKWRIEYGTNLYFPELEDTFDNCINYINNPLININFI